MSNIKGYCLSIFKGVEIDRFYFFTSTNHIRQPLYPICPTLTQIENPEQTIYFSVNYFTNIQIK